MSSSFARIYPRGRCLSGTEQLLDLAKSIWFLPSASDATRTGKRDNFPGASQAMPAVPEGLRAGTPVAGYFIGTQDDRGRASARATLGRTICALNQSASVHPTCRR
jgi:hypothetical protein